MKSGLLPKLEDISWSEMLKKSAQGITMPIIAIAIFLLLWDASASQIQTSLGQVPGPAQVWRQSVNLYQEHQAERDKELAFYQRQEDRNAKKLAENPDAEVKLRDYTGKPTFIDQIITSIITVTTGFLLASII
ncbi:MAG: ABC transporter permease, partial [Gammaproteobacteria bacterium]|nr:ABC transporter permease [Gammaproteobacteria bacterium]